MGSPRQSNKRNAENQATNSPTRSKRLRFVGPNSCGLESELSEMNFDGSEHSSDTENDKTKGFVNINNRKRAPASPLRYPGAITRESVSTVHKSHGDFQVKSSPSKVRPHQPQVISSSTTTAPIRNITQTPSSSSAQTPTRKNFESKYNYLRRLKQLPSQLSAQSQHNTPVSPAMSSASSSSIMSSQSSTSLNLNKTNKVYLDDALRIFEDMLTEREERLKMEFKIELEKKLAEQYDQFIKYNEEFIRSQISQSSCSYLS